jgi:Leucine-rich repeat (LRR) protein
MEPWKSHTVAAYKNKGYTIPYKNQYHGIENINNVASNNSNNDRKHYKNISQRLEEIQSIIAEIKSGQFRALFLDQLGLTDLSDIPGLMDVLDRVTSLSCSYNPITDLPNLRKMAPQLVTFYCNGTQITELPPLPDTLTSLSCSSNRLRSLPRPLPSNLMYLNCSSNELIYLPPLPLNLRQLVCEYNQLKELPKLPLSLTHLYTNNNQLRFLPKLPPLLSWIKAQGNPFEAPFNEPPLNQFLKGNKVLLYTELRTLRPIINDYYDQQTVETLATEFVNPESQLSAGTGKRTGYGFPVGPNVSLLKFLNISKPQNKKSFNQTRANLRTKLNPNPLSNVNTGLFKGGTRRSKRSKYTRRK